MRRITSVLQSKSDESILLFKIPRTLIYIQNQYFLGYLTDPCYTELAFKLCNDIEIFTYKYEVEK